MQVEYLGTTCSTHFASYRKGQIALQLLTEEGFPFARATVNVEEIKLQPDEIFVYERQYQGITQALLNAGVVSQPHAEHRLGFLCKLTAAAYEEYRIQVGPETHHESPPSVHNTVPEDSEWSMARPL